MVERVGGLLNNNVPGTWHNLLLIEGNMELVLYPHFVRIGSLVV